MHDWGLATLLKDDVIHRTHSVHVLFESKLTLTCTLARFDRDSEVRNRVLEGDGQIPHHEHGNQRKQHKMDGEDQFETAQNYGNRMKRKIFTQSLHHSIAPFFIVRVPSLGVNGMALWPFILVQRGNPSARLLNHERIHHRQQLEMLLLPFYVWYVLEYAYHRLRGLDHYAAMGRKQTAIVEALYTKVFIAMGEQ